MDNNHTGIPPYHDGKSRYVSEDNIRYRDYYCQYLVNVQELADQPKWHASLT